VDSVEHCLESLSTGITRFARQLGQQRDRNGGYLPAYVIGPRGAEHSWSAEVTQRDQRLRLRSQDAGEVLAPLVPKYVRMAILRVRAFETGPAWWILPWVMPALLAICFAKNLDG
jgi:hypothetical protein